MSRECERRATTRGARVWPWARTRATGKTHSRTPNSQTLCGDHAPQNRQQGVAVCAPFGCRTGSSPCVRT
eukprot:5152288-Prymnesium_polylepis.1